MGDFAEAKISQKAMYYIHNIYWDEDGVTMKIEYESSYKVMSDMLKCIVIFSRGYGLEYPLIHREKLELDLCTKGKVKYKKKIISNVRSKKIDSIYK